jgi:hypothetical protein
VYSPPILPRIQYFFLGLKLIFDIVKIYSILIRCFCFFCVKKIDQHLFRIISKLFLVCSFSVRNKKQVSVLIMVILPVYLAHSPVSPPPIFPRIQYANACTKESAIPYKTKTLTGNSQRDEETSIREEGRVSRS